MDVGHLLRAARRGAGLTLRALAARAGTSHATLAAYEGHRTSPTAATLARVIAASGHDASVTLTRRAGADPAERAEELLAVLDLAEHFPARPARHLAAPVFGRP